MLWNGACSVARNSAIRIIKTHIRCNIQQSSFGREENYCTLNVDAYQDLHKTIKNICYGPAHLPTGRPPAHMGCIERGPLELLRKCVFIHFYCMKCAVGIYGWQTRRKEIDAFDNIYEYDIYIKI